METVKILILVTICGALGPNQQPTGLWLEEFTTPYYMFVDAGYEVEVASITGGPTPIDKRSFKEGIPSVERYQKDKTAQKALGRTIPIEKVDLDHYQAIFIPGGHGTMGDLPDSPEVGQALSHFMARKQPVVAVCHGPAALLALKTVGGEKYLRGRKVCGFSNEEEAASHLGEAVPFLLEDALKDMGAKVSTGPAFKAYVVVDGNLITGQNPASAGPAASELLKLLR